MPKAKPKCSCKETGGRCSYCDPELAQLSRELFRVFQEMTTKPAKSQKQKGNR